MPHKPVILLAFANSDARHLAALGEEIDAIYDSMQSYADREYLELFPRFHANRDKVASAIADYSEQIELFHFSGHAGMTHLQLTDGNSHTKGLARMIGQLPHLKLVILNGCASKGQIQHLFQHGVPAVIATSAPVGDKQAMLFSKHFYHRWSRGSTLEEAFQHAWGYLDSLNPADQSMMRSLELEETEDNEDDVLWGLYWNPGEDQAKQTALKQWRLPQGTAQNADLPADLPLPPDPKEGLYHRLKTLNYAIHVPMLQQYIRRHDITGFLIHGNKMDGQTWLGGNHLTQFDELNPATLSYFFQLGHLTNAVPDLVTNFKYKLGLLDEFESFEQDLPLLADRLAKQLAHQSILIRIDGTAGMFQQGFLAEMVSTFWHPLAQAIESQKTTRESTITFKKLVLLVVVTDCPIQLDLPCLSQQVLDEFRTDQLLMLPEIQQIGSKEFWEWLNWDSRDPTGKILVKHDVLHNIHQDFLPPYQKALEFLGDPNGLPPITLMRKVCHHLNYLLLPDGQNNWELKPQPQF